MIEGCICCLVFSLRRLAAPFLTEFDHWFAPTMAMTEQEQMDAYHGQESGDEDFGDVVNSSMDDSAHREKKVVYAGNIPEDTTQEQLKVIFIPFGPITQVQIPLNYKTQKNKGYGFITFEDREDAAHARENMHNSEFRGRCLNVAVARPIRVKLGSRTAVWSHQEGAEAPGKHQSTQKKTTATDEDAMMAMDK